MKKIYLFFILIGLQCLSFIEAKEIRGRILKTETSKAFSGLKVCLSTINDSILAYTITNHNGYFAFLSVPENIDSVKICIGTDFQICQQYAVPSYKNNVGKIKIPINNVTAQDFNPITFYEKEVLKMRSQGFTTQPNATLQDLVNKIPGTAYSNSINYALGEPTQEILINGYMYFSDNMDAVLKNFPTDFVDTIEIYDDVSFAKLATGFDDDESARAIDFYQKKSYNKSLFGNVYAGLGSDYKYNMGLNINYFNGAQHLSIVQQTNNVNNFNYSSYDLNKIFGKNAANTFDDRAGESSIQGFVESMNNFLVDLSQGVNDNNMFGVNYLDRRGKLAFYGNYFFNETNNMTQSKAIRSYFSETGQYNNYEETDLSNSINRNHRFRAKFYYYIDDLSHVRISPKIYIQETRGTISDEATIGNTEISIPGGNSSSRNNSNINMSSQQISIETNYTKAFDKNKQRTLTANFTPYFLKKEGNWLLNSKSYISFYEDTLASRTDYLQNVGQLKADIAYTHPISSNIRLLLGYYTNFQTAETDKDFTIEEFHGFGNSAEISPMDTNMMMHLQSTYADNSLKLMAQITGKYWRLNPGITYQNTFSHNDESPIVKNDDQIYNYFLPAVYFTYSKDRLSRFSVNYKSYTTRPTVEQLQNTVNITNPLNFAVGNINLKPSINNSLNLRYLQMLHNERNQLNLFLGSIYTNDYIGTQNSTEFHYSDSGNDSIQVFVKRPVNLDNYFNTRLFIEYNSHILPLQSNVGVSLFTKYSHIPTMNQKHSFFSNQSASGLIFSLSSDITEKLDFLLASTTTYNYTLSTLSGSSASEYVNQHSYFQVNLTLFNSLVFSSDISHDYNITDAKDFKENRFLWNAYVGYKFLREKCLEARFSIYNILNQSQNTSYTVTDYYTENIQSNSLQRYFMVSLFYKLNRPNLQF